MMDDLATISKCGIDTIETNAYIKLEANQPEFFLENGHTVGFFARHQQYYDASTTSGSSGAEYNENIN